MININVYCVQIIIEFKEQQKEKKIACTDGHESDVIYQSPTKTYAE